MREFLRPIFMWPGENRGLLIALWFHFGLVVLSLAALPFDHRVILGLNPWIKPLKFDLSVIIYLATIAVLLHLLGSRWRRSRALVGWGVAVAMMVEDSIISGQSLRGVPSHMNYTSLFNGVAFGMMGAFILFNTVLVGVLFVLYLRPTQLAAALAWGIRLGLAAFLAGSIEGVLMVVHGGHTVGAHDGLPGLPFVNWAYGHGDLRVAHFFALHTLQAAPLLGWALGRTRLRVGTQLATLVTGFVAYVGLVWRLFSEAMAGRPLIH